MLFNMELRTRQVAVKTDFTSWSSVKRPGVNCMHMQPDRGDAEAKKLLENDFGNESKITSTYIEMDATMPCKT